MMLPFVLEHENEILKECAFQKSLCAIEQIIFLLNIKSATTVKCKYHTKDVWKIKFLENCFA